MCTSIFTGFIFLYEINFMNESFYKFVISEKKFIKVIFAFVSNLLLLL